MNIPHVFLLGSLLSILLFQNEAMAAGPADLTDLSANVKSYLPTTATKTNCDIRAQYVSAELSIRKIPNQLIYINRCRPTKTNNLISRKNEEWKYHVAVAIGDQSEQRVFDPSMDSLPLSITKWVETSINRVRSPSFFVNFDLYQEIGVQSPYCEGQKRDAFYPTVASSVEAENFVYYCQAMFTDIEKERLSPAQKKAKKEKLIKRSIEIIRELFDSSTMNSFSSLATWEQEFSNRCRQGLLAK